MGEDQEEDDAYQAYREENARGLIGIPPAVQRASWRVD